MSGGGKGAGAILPGFSQILLRPGAGGDADAADAVPYPRPGFFKLVGRFAAGKPVVQRFARHADLPVLAGYSPAGADFGAGGAFTAL